MPQTIQPPSRQFTRPIAHGFWRGAHFSATLGRTVLFSSCV
jgi:hypothetical protein